MSTQNDHIREYLDRYIEKKRPGYAVLIKGKWGSGKTWFIDDYFKNRPAEVGAEDLEQALVGEGIHAPNYLYVSLYGIRSTAAINDELFSQIHPRLASKGMRLVGSILKSTLKVTANFDVNHDGKPDGNLSLGLPAGELLNIAKKAAKKVIVFDDLERCQMNINETLGFINQFVEHDGAQVIVLANQEEIESRTQTDDDRNEYGRIKEKLIGKELEVFPDINSAIEKFSAELRPAVATKIEPHIEKIVTIYKQSGHDNLRRIRQALLEFDAAISVLDHDILANADFFGQFLSLFCIFSLEIGAGSLGVDELGSLMKWPYLGLMRNELAPADKKIIDVAKKYIGTDMTTAVLSYDTWASIISSGHIDKETLVTEIGNSPYFRSGQTPSWITFWGYSDMTTDGFYSALIAMEREFEQGGFHEAEVVLHLAGIFIALSNKGLYSRSPGAILDQALKNVDDIRARGLIRPSSHDTRPFRDSGWGGYGFHGADTTEFKQIVTYIRTLQHEESIAQTISEVRDLVTRMEADVRTFVTALTIGTQGGGKFATYPVLPLIDVDFFLTVWKRMNNHDRRMVGYIFSERSKHANIIRDAGKELAWLNELLHLIQVESAVQTTIFARESFDYFSEEIEKAIDAYSNLT